VFLSGEGRSNANCWAADLFFAQSEEWERDWAEQNLPEGLHDVLAMMGEALHDTIQAPEIAKNFGCLPEQLLERLRQLPDAVTVHLDSSFQVSDYEVTRLSLFRACSATTGVMG
jgi:hypothetical protein